jgi:hypothetical protein
MVYIEGLIICFPREYKGGTNDPAFSIVIDPKAAWFIKDNVAGKGGRCPYLTTIG